MEKPKILVVEDERIVAQDIKVCLEDLGYTVTSLAASGEEAVEKVIRERPDLVLMDIVLDGKMDGIEAVSKIRSSFDIPIVYLTAYSDEQTLERAKNTGPFGYMLKPFDEKDIYATIEIALHKHRLEKELKEEKAKTEAIIAAMGEGLCIVDADFRILYVNKAYKDLFGEHENEFCYSAIHDNKKICEDCPVVLCFKDSSIHTLEKTAHTNKGIRDIEVTASPLRDASGRITAAVKIVRDITDRKRLEEYRHETEKLKSISILAAGLSHDFNNLLTAILGNVSLAKMFVSPEDRVFRVLDGAENASLRARNLVYQFRTLSENTVPRKKRVFITEAVIKDFADLVFTDRRITPEFIMQDDLWPVEIDEDQIKQAINNIVKNAMEAMPGGGTVRIAGKNIPYGKEEDILLGSDRYIKLSIIDHGVGILEDNLRRISDPYFSTKPRGNQKGMGLGLTISYGIIKKHDGLISLDSKRGVGTTFNIYLPAANG